MAMAIYYFCVLAYVGVCWRVLACVGVCWRVLACVGVCRRVLGGLGLHHYAILCPVFITGIPQRRIHAPKLNRLVSREPISTLSFLLGRLLKHFCYLMSRRPRGRRLPYSDIKVMTSSGPKRRARVVSPYSCQSSLSIRCRASGRGPSK